MQRYKESTKQRNYFFHPASMQIQPKPVVGDRKTGGRFRTGTIHRPIWGKSGFHSHRCKEREGSVSQTEPSIASIPLTITSSLQY